MCVDEEAGNLVAELNSELYEQLGDSSNKGKYSIINNAFVALSNGFSTVINFGDFNMWDSEENAHYDEFDNRIPIRQIVVEKFRKLQFEIAQIQLDREV